MKKNWIWIALCMVFIWIYQVKVLNPYQAKNRPVPAVPKDAASTAVEVKTAVTQAGVTAPAFSIPVVTEADLAKAVSVTLSEKRSLRLMPDLSISRATFEDYRIRESTESKPVVILEKPLRWRSSDARVQKCFDGLRSSTTPLTTNTSIENTAEGGACRLRFASDSTKPGWIHYEASIRGFTDSKGTLILGAEDLLGSGPVTDHNYLGYKIDKTRSWVKEKNLFEATAKEGRVDWLVWGDKYFMIALVPGGAFNPNLFYGAGTGDDPNADILKRPVSYGFQYPVVAKADTWATYEVSVYVGTRDPEQLAQGEGKLADAVDLGFFGSLTRLLIWLLNRFNIVFRNYGLSIIALTVMVRLILWPLNKKVYVSGLKMKAIQPQIEKIRAKYGSDKTKVEQMNRELIGLYKTNQVNPVGSCLPLFLQLPIFMGLYAALGHSLDLYQAPFVGWIHDLSSKDPWYVFPALWTASLLAYMKLNPQAMNSQPGQPDMKWLMIGMNLFFGFLSKDWPAGLTLYLFVSNLLGVLQQILLRKDPKLQTVQEGA